MGLPKAHAVFGTGVLLALVGAVLVVSSVHGGRMAKAEAYGDAVNAWTNSGRAELAAGAFNVSLGAATAVLLPSDAPDELRDDGEELLTYDALTFVGALALADAAGSGAVRVSADPGGAWALDAPVELDGLSALCLQVELRDGAWQSPESGRVGCEGGTAWAVAAHDAHGASDADTVAVRVRAAGDPFLAAVDITDGSLSFSEPVGAARHWGVALVLGGLAMLLLPLVSMHCQLAKQHEPEFLPISQDDEDLFTPPEFFDDVLGTDIEIEMAERAESDVPSTVADASSRRPSTAGTVCQLPSSSESSSAGSDGEPVGESKSDDEPDDEEPEEDEEEEDEPPLVEIAAPRRKRDALLDQVGDFAKIGGEPLPCVERPLERPFR